LTFLPLETKLCFFASSFFIHLVASSSEFKTNCGTFSKNCNDVDKHCPNLIRSTVPAFAWNVSVNPWEASIVIARLQAEIWTMDLWIPSKSTTRCMAVFDVEGTKGLGGSVQYCIIDNTNRKDCAFGDMSCYTADPCRFQIVSRNSDGHVTICLLANSLHSCLKTAQRYYINC